MTFEQTAEDDSVTRGMATRAMANMLADSRADLGSLREVALTLHRAGFTALEVAAMQAQATKLARTIRGMR